MKRTILLALAALAAPLAAFAASPAATQAWVTNYVNLAIQSVGSDELPTNVVAGAIDVAAGTLTFTYEGTVYTVGISATNSPASQAAYCVTESSDPAAVPTNTLFVLDESTGRYANRTVPFPNDLDLNMVGGCPHLTQTSGVWRALSTGITNLSYVVVESNGIYQYSFRATKRTVTRTEALAAGVTNAANATAAIPAPGVLDILSRMFVGTAYADSAAAADRATSFDLWIYYTLSDGTTRETSVTFRYNYYYYDWNHEPDEGYALPKKNETYVPDMWPYRKDWYSAANWKADTQQDNGKIAITSWIKRGGVYTEVSVAVTRDKLAKLASSSISALIPAFVAPELVDNSVQDCQSGNHYWVKCVCEYCEKTRNHELAPVDGQPTKCYRCTNRDGYADESGGAVCGSSCIFGDTRSDISKHRGWHDSDGKALNEMACTCECYGKANCTGWSVVHEPDGAKYDTGVGQLDEDGSVVAGTEDEYHHYSTKCQRKADGVSAICGAKVNFNEAHDFVNVEGKLPHPFIGEELDPELITILDYGTQAEDANEEQHYLDNMTCLTCGRVKSGFAAHVFGSDSCDCLMCGLVVHEPNDQGVRDGGYTCGSKTVPGCARCNTYSPTGSRAGDRTSNLKESLHECFAEDEYYHVCVCGRVRAEHFLQATSRKNYYKCKYCPYEYYDDSGDGPDPRPMNYIVRGGCGEWFYRDDTVFTGGTEIDASGTYQYFPSRHDFILVTNRLCMVCTNYNPLTGRQCGEHDAENIGHHGGWHNSTASASNEVTGTSGPCVCQCGLYHQEHEAATDDPDLEYLPTADGKCLKVGHCKHIGESAADKRCGYYCTNEVEHSWVVSNTPSVYVDATNHLSKYVCTHTDAPGCGMVTNILEEHFYKTLSDIPIWRPEDITNHYYVEECLGIDNLAGCHHTNYNPEAHSMLPDYHYATATTHIISNVCTECQGSWLFRESEHVPVDDTPRGYAPNGSWHHDVSNQCSLTEGCGQLFVGTFAEQCTFTRDWVLGDSNDFVRCAHCSNSTNMPHNFVPDSDTMHHCNHDEGHLWEGHTWGTADTNLCTKCGWNRETHSREDWVYSITRCSSCSNSTDFCYQKMRSRLGAGIWEVCETRCDAGWDAINNICGCPMCQLGVPFGCSCSFSYLFYGPLVAPISGSTTITNQ